MSAPLPLCAFMQDAVWCAKRLLALTTECLPDLLSPEGLPVLGSVLQLSADLLEWAGPSMTVNAKWPVLAPLHKTYTGDHSQDSVPEFGGKCIRPCPTVCKPCTVFTQPFLLC
jgi:hypothetical protein